MKKRQVLGAVCVHVINIYDMIINKDISIRIIYRAFVSLLNLFTIIIVSGSAELVETDVVLLKHAVALTVGVAFTSLLELTGLIFKNIYVTIGKYVDERKFYSDQEGELKWWFMSSIIVPVLIYLAFMLTLGTQNPAAIVSVFMIFYISHRSREIWSKYVVLMVTGGWNEPLD